MTDEQVFGRRIRALGFGLLLIGLLTVARLFWLQVIRHGHYALLASNEQLHKFEVAPERGTVYLSDRGESTPLAMNQDLKRIYADDRFIKDPAATARALGDAMGVSPGTLTGELKGDGAYVVLFNKVKPERAMAVAGLELPGIGVQNEPVRVYPEGTMAAQVLGFVNGDGAGQYGVEQQYNDVLAGQTGLLKATTDIRGIPIATSNNYQVPPRRGSDIVLTIDRNIQAKVEQVLHAGGNLYHPTGASALVMDANSGAILAMANWPTYSPAHFNQVSNYAVFSDRVATDVYEPGSVMKIVTMAAGLDSGAVTPQTTYTDNGFVKLDGYTISNAPGIPTGVHNMRYVIAHSVNSGAIFVLTALGGGNINPQGKSKLRAYLTDHFKFGTPTGVDLPGEPAGTINPVSASDVNYANMSFGQGMTVTMLQVASAYGAVGNGGTLYEPYVVDGVISPDGTVTKHAPVVRNQAVASPATLAKLRSMLLAVVEEGTSGDAKIPGYEIGGKSGTAQLPNPAGGYFEHRDIGSFIGPEPLDKPKLVIMVRIDQPTGVPFASTAARQLWNQITRWVLPYWGVGPSH